MKKIEVLVATLDQNNFDKYKKMNINSDVIFANQSNRYEFNEEIIDDNEVRMITTNTIGVGKNRNQALLLSNADICIIGDDDIIYVDEYKKIIQDAFHKVPKADILIFNIETNGTEARRRQNKRVKKVGLLNFQNYGAVRIAFKREKIIKSNLWFSLLFGGGAKYSSGEDSLFLREAIRKKIKIYTYPEKIGTVDQTESTWFSGYNEKFFFDKGAILAAMFPNLKYFFAIIYFPLRFRSFSEFSKIKTIKLLLNGIKGFKYNMTYKEFIVKNKGENFEKI